MSEPAVSAFDRVQTRPLPDRPEPRGWKGAVLAVLVVAGVALAVWLWPGGDEGGSFLGQLRESSQSVSPDLLTSSAEEAQGYVAEAMGWSIPPPSLPDLALVGVGVPSVATVRPGPSASETDVSVPVFRYEGQNGERALVYVYDYILLDQLGGALDLPEATYAVLSEPAPVDARVIEGTYLVTWRDRAMLFTAVTPDEAVAERIRQAVVPGSP